LKFHRERIHEKEPKYHCQTCGNVFISYTALRYHEKTRHETPQVEEKCKLCGKVFNNTNPLKDHMRRVHKVYKDNREKHCDAGTFQCDICDKEFMTLKESKRHANIAHKEQSHKPAECKECGLVFHKKYLLRTHHNIVHLKQRDLSCGQCDFKTAYKKSLGLHIKVIHQKIKDYNCEHCGSWFSQKSHLERHMCIHGKDCKCMNNSSEPSKDLSQENSDLIPNREMETVEEFETVFIWLKCQESNLVLSNAGSSCHLPLFY